MDGEPGYNIGVIRNLLLSAFTAEELRRFCFDRPLFRPIVDQFGEHFGLDDMVDAVIMYCEKHPLFDELLAEVERVNPKQYAKFAYFLRGPSGSVGGTPPRGSGCAASLGQVRVQWWVTFAALLAVGVTGYTAVFLAGGGTDPLPPIGGLDAGSLAILILPIFLVTLVVFIVLALVVRRILRRLAAVPHRQK